jgi:hypothetical protein
VAVLRIVRPVRLRLTDNLPGFNNPRRLFGLRILSPVRLRVGTAPRTFLLSGTVKDGSGSGKLGRTIRIFADQGMGSPIAVTYTLSDGSWSVSVPGGPGSRFVAVEQGEVGENCQIFSMVVPA